MMYSDAEEFSYASRGSLQCSSIGTGQPITPDSVLGTNIMLDGNGSIGGGEDRASDDANGTQKSTISTSPPSLPSSSSSSSQEDDASDLSSPRLLNILKTESAEQYEVTPNYLHSSVLMNKLPSPSVDSKDQGVSERCRRRTCEWMYDICDYFQLNRGKKKRCTIANPSTHILFYNTLLIPYAHPSIILYDRGGRHSIILCR